MLEVHSPSFPLRGLYAMFCIFNVFLNPLLFQFIIMIHLLISCTKQNLSYLKNLDSIGKIENLKVIDGRFYCRESMIEYAFYLKFMHILCSHKIHHTSISLQKSIVQLFACVSVQRTYILLTF